MDLAFDRVGVGKPVVFLHSGLANRTMWDPQLEAISRLFTCFAVDLPGYGESGSPADSYSNAAEIALFIESSIGAPAALIGSSYGAGIALETALVSPEWTGPLVFVNGLLINEGERSEIVQAIWNDADAAWDAGDRDRAVEIEIEGWVDGRGRPGGKAAADVRDYFTRTNQAIWDRHDRDPLPETLAGPDRNLAAIEQPVLLIDGPYDVPDVLSSNQLALERAPNASYVSIPDSAHFPSREQADQFNRVVLDFLRHNWAD